MISHAEASWVLALADYCLMSLFSMLGDATH